MRSSLLAAFTTLPIVTLALGGCHHATEDAAGTTTIRSGSVGGPRVTDVAASKLPGMADRLTDAICRRERACRHAATASASRSGSAACVREVHQAAALTVQALPCSPSVAATGFEDCLAAVQSESCETNAGFSTGLTACRPSQMCSAGMASR